MKRCTTLGLLAASALVFGAGATVAQDWSVTDVPDRKATVAVLEFDNGVSIAARCMDDHFEVLLTGLPEVPTRETSRALSISIGEEPLGAETWTVGRPASIAFSRVPAPFARRLAKGGAFQIAVPGLAGQPRTRYVMELPPSPMALERTLTACGRALVDPRDLLLSRNAVDGLAAPVAETPGVGPTGPVWTRRPAPEFPSGSRIAEAGTVTLSCLTRADGHLGDCVVESEHPPSYGFAEAALKAARRAQLGPSQPGGVVEGAMVLYSTSFRLE